MYQSNLQLLAIRQTVKKWQVKPWRWTRSWSSHYTGPVLVRSAGIWVLSDDMALAWRVLAVVWCIHDTVRLAAILQLGCHVTPLTANSCVIIHSCLLHVLIGKCTTTCTVWRAARFLQTKHVAWCPTAYFIPTQYSRFLFLMSTCKHLITRVVR